MRFLKTALDYCKEKQKSQWLKLTNSLWSGGSFWGICSIHPIKRTGICFARISEIHPHLPTIGSMVRIFILFQTFGLNYRCQQYGSKCNWVDLIFQNSIYGFYL